MLFRSNGCGIYYDINGKLKYKGEFYNNYFIYNKNRSFNIFSYFNTKKKYNIKYEHLLTYYDEFNLF